MFVNMFLNVDRPYTTPFGPLAFEQPNEGNPFF